jgi:hypothetical protein
MKLSIHRETACSHEELRALLIDAAEQLAGNGARILESKLPWDGHPILLADAELHPVIVSFDIKQSQAALLNGLMAVEKLSSALAWVNQVYEILQHLEQTPKLVVVSAEFPPGASTILAACTQLQLFQFKTLRINGETGLWLEPMTDEPRVERSSPGDLHTLAPAPFPPREALAEQTSPPENPAEDSLPELSNEEMAYFQQL